MFSFGMEGLEKATIKVPDTILGKLICDTCEGHLSRGPVLMLDNGKNRCGRCIKPEDGGRRNIVYEEVATLLIFPCRYKKHGCPEMVKFTENQPHEEICIFRPFVCPIGKSTKCEWLGIHGDFFGHWKTKHPENVAQNPFKLHHDISKSSSETYILSAFQVLFIIHINVCVTTRNISHAVHLIGATKNNCTYKYEVCIENKGNKVIKPGSAEPLGCKVSQGDSVICTSIDGLLQILGDFKDTTFTLTVSEQPNLQAIRISQRILAQSGQLEHTPQLVNRCINAPTPRPLLFR